MSVTLSIFIYLTENKHKEGTVGTSFSGVKNEILSPDPVTGEGEIIVSSRAVFMGYVKVCILNLYKSLLKHTHNI